MNQVMKSQTSSESLQLDYCVGLLLATLDDVAITLSYQTTEKWNDGRVIVRRATSEGIRFVTETLPSLAKALDKALATDDLFECPPGFKTRRDSRIPVFLGSVFELVFDEFGIQRSDASIMAVSCLRQVLYLFYKLELPPSQTQIDETLQRFKQTEAELQHKVGPVLAEAERWMQYPPGPFEKVPTFCASDDPTDQIDLETLVLARRLVCAVLGGSNPKDERFRPKHGPGAVATGEKEEKKMIFKRYYTELARVFPYPDYFYYNFAHLCDELHRYLSLEELSSGTAKVVLVPKDSRGPRLISCEPLEYQWIQQMPMANMVSTIERHKLTKGLVNFTDQSVNRRQALLGSTCESNYRVTLDMKDASDRVHAYLVRILFPTTWVEALMASRTTATLLPTGEVVQLSKFAPMGSATCFPVEAITFWALCTATVINKRLRETSRAAAAPWLTLEDLTSESMFQGGSRVIHVYGDDIICHREDHSDVKRTLHAVGLRLNVNKCCVGKTFRESCGCDAFRGVDVTPLRLKATWSHRLTPNQVLGHVAFHNAMIERRWFNTALYAEMKISQRIDLPYVRLERHPLTGAAQDDLGYLHLLMPEESGSRTKYPERAKRRYNYKSHTWERLTWVASATSRFKRGATNWGEILRKESHRTGLENPIRKYASQVVKRPPTPVGRDGALVCWAQDITPIAKACWYTSARQVSLRRVWITS